MLQMVEKTNEVCLRCGGKAVRSQAAADRAGSKTMVCPGHGEDSPDTSPVIGGSGYRLSITQGVIIRLRSEAC